MRQNIGVCSYQSMVTLFFHNDKSKSNSTVLFRNFEENSESIPLPKLEKQSLFSTFKSLLLFASFSTVQQIDWYFLIILFFHIFTSRTVLLIAISNLKTSPEMKRKFYVSIISFLLLSSSIFPQACNVWTANTAGTLSAAVTAACAAGGGHIKIASGTYTIDNELILCSNLILEGGYNAGFTAKSSTAGLTVISRSQLNPANNPSGGGQYIRGIYGTGISNFRLQDLTISVANAAAGSQISNYGVYLNNCSSYYVTRCVIISGNAGSGVAGNAGSAGGGGGVGATGFNGDPDNENYNQGYTSAGGSSACCTGGYGGGGSWSSAYSGTGSSGSCGGGTGGGGGGDNCNLFGCSSPGTGGTGGAGTSGTAGASGAAGSAGSFVSDFYVPGGTGASGAAGGNGTGGGGGGGGGAEYGGLCNDGCGGSGGGGGGGGCGGTGGTGGSGGGGTFAILIVNNGANGFLVDNQYNLGTGGAGGAGGSGGTGGSGGAGGAGGWGGNCDVGIGGNGGAGGNGASGGTGGAGQTGTAAGAQFISGTALALSTTATLSSQPTLTATLTGCTNSNISISGCALGSTKYPSFGIYNITYCSTTYTGFIIIDKGRVTPSITAGGPLSFCTGGSVVLTSTDGGIPPYSSYQWYRNAVLIPGATTQTYTATISGTYTVVGVTPCCGNSTASASVVVTVTPLDDPTFTYSSSSYCVNGADPFPTISGLAGGTFTSAAGLFVNSSTGEVLLSSSTVGGPYTVTYTTNGTCPNTGTFDITIFAASAPTFSGLGASYCVSDNTPVTLTGSPGGGTFSGPGVSGTTFTPSSAGTGTQSITYTYTGGGCTGTSTQTVVVNSLPSVTFTGLSAMYCLNDAAVNISGMGSPSGGTFSGPGVTGGSFDPASAGPGTATITYTYIDGNGCSGTATQSVFVNSLPVVSFTGLTGPYCSDNATPVALTGVPSGGTFAGNGISGTTFTPSLAAPGANTIDYSYTDGNGCTNTSSQTVTVNAIPTVSFSGLSSPYCANNSTPVTLTGLPVGGTFSGPGVSANTFTPSVAGVGAHSIMYTYTDGNGCVNSQTQTAVVNALPTVTFSGLNPIYCTNSSSATLTGFPAGGSFSGTGIVGSTFNPSTAGAGTFVITYTYTDVNSCSNTSTQTVTVSAPPIVSFSGLSSPYCISSPAIPLTGNPSGGTFSGTGISANSFYPSVAGIGTFTITYTYSDINGCSNTSSQTVTVTANPVPTITAGGPTTFCQGGSVTLTASAGTSYLWSTGSTNNSIVVTTGGPYTVTVTNSNGCQGTSLPFTITVNPAPTASITPNGPTTFCPGGAVILVANPSGSTYLWSNAATTQNITATTGGTYTVTVTAVNGCSAVSAPVIVTVNPLPTATITPAGPITLCSGSSATLTSSAGTSYLWSNGATTQATSVSTGGSYTVIVTSNLGCTNTSAPVTVNVVNVVPATISASGPTSFCPGGNVTLTANSGTSYLWSTGSTLSSITVNTAGSYSVIVTDANGCTSTSAQVVVNIGNFPATITASGPTSFCPGGNVTLNASAFGVSWLWSDGSTTSSITPSIAGSYSVTITYSGGCSSTSSPTVVTVFPPASASVTAVPSSDFCIGSTVTMTASVGTAYEWNTGDSTQSKTTGTSGIYTVTVTDANGCYASASITLTGYNMPVAGFTSVNNLTTTTFTNTSTNGLNYDWHFGDSNTSNLPNPVHNYFWDGTYTVMLIVSNPCGSDTIIHTVTIVTNGIPDIMTLNDFHVFPNPSEGIFTIHTTIGTSDAIELTVKDVLGNILYSASEKNQKGEYTKTIDLSNNSKGIYFLNIQRGNYSCTKKIILN